MPVLPNSRHELFCQELAKGKTAEEAHGLAGYKASRSGASQLKQNIDISNRVAELLAEREVMHGQASAKAVEKVSLTKAWVLSRLIENAERALQAVAVKMPDGTTSGEYKYDGTVANRALELLGKEMGMFIERKEVGQPGDFASLRDDELLAKIKDSARALGVTVPKQLHS